MPDNTNEGELSVAKAQVVRNVRLARLARSKPLLMQYQLRIHPFDNYLWTPNGCDSVLGLFDGGPKTTFKGKRLADGIESLIGAFYLTGAAAEAARNTAAAATGSDGPPNRTAAAAAAAGLGSEIYGVNEPSVPALLDAASWVWHRVSQPGLEAAAALCEVLEVLPAGKEGKKEGRGYSLFAAVCHLHQLLQPPICLCACAISCLYAVHVCGALWPPLAAAW
jgi:hypothetical protein